ncbi:hypothetical protein RRG08_018095 [Elysia crispata]|uniref:Uncharacterized protein n=1 Tax=Elysia crispata TaxID=231223 RepID=A0AAE0ZDE5_9GAST|nr:hypothetical protein RRG08_018095 [Elysia crispata]
MLRCGIQTMRGQMAVGGRRPDSGRRTMNKEVRRTIEDVLIVSAAPPSREDPRRGAKHGLRERKHPR